jgi:hypothetical protein
VSQREELLQAYVRELIAEGFSLRQAQREFSRGYVRKLMLQTKGNKAAAARIAKIRRPSLFRIIHKLGLEEECLRLRRAREPTAEDLAEKERTRQGCVQNLQAWLSQRPRSPHQALRV